MAEVQDGHRKAAEAWFEAALHDSENEMPDSAPATYAQALADQDARLLVFMRKMAEGWDRRGMEGIGNAIRGECREIERGAHLGIHVPPARTVEDVVAWLEGPNFYTDEEDENGDTGEGRHSGSALGSAKAIRKKFGLPEQEPW